MIVSRLLAMEISAKGSVGLELGLIGADLRVWLGLLYSRSIP